MITINNTPNFAGVYISGDFNDLYQLVDAFHAITIDEYAEKNQSHIAISTRLLGLCYDIRHAFQGNREVVFVDNGMDQDTMKFHSIVAPKNNIYYKCDVLYPEMFFAMLALNALVKLRMSDLVKSKYLDEKAFDNNIIWDDTIATIRCFQAEFAKCVKEALSETSYVRWLKYMNSEYISIEDIAGQYVDLVNIKYIKMSKEKRLKNLHLIAKQIADFQLNADHSEIKEAVTQAAKQLGCCEGDLRIEGVQYPDEWLW